MKHVLVIGSTNSGGKNDPSIMAEHLQNAGHDVSLCYWEDLVFDISTGDVKILTGDSDLASDLHPDLVIAVGWYKSGKEAYYRDLAFSLALYLEKANVKFWNSEMKHQRSTTKLSCMVQLALEGVSVPHSLFSLNAQKLPLSEGAAVIKAISASRGESNYLVNSRAEAKDVLTKMPMSLVQPFMPNDHDLRVICFGGEPSLFLRRSRGENAATHLNNTSQGGSAEWLDKESISEELLTASHKISIIMKREMGGIDFIPDPSSPYGYSCLEVNAIPQLTSGYDTKNKLHELAIAIEHLESETR